MPGAGRWQDGPGAVTAPRPGPRSAVDRARPDGGAGV